MVSKYPILLVKVVLDFFLYYIIRYIYMTIFTCYLLIDIKNPVNIWWNEKYLVPLHQK